MNRRFIFLATMLTAMAAGRSLAAIATNAVAATNAPATNDDSTKAPAARTDNKIDFDSFKLVRERNIFDMSRTGRIGPRPAPRVVHVDDFTLVGTLSYEKGQYAFFDGSSSEYRQNLKPGDKIASFKIAAIGSDYVDLISTNNKTIRMQLSTAMRREDKGPWSGPTMRNDTILADTSNSSSRDTADRSNRTDRSDRRSNRNSRGDRSGGSTSGMGDPGPGVSTPDSKSDNSASSNESDIIKRLMEKRAQQTKDN